MVMTTITRTMAEEEGRRADADTNMPAEVADKIRNRPPARLTEVDNDVGYKCKEMLECDILRSECPNH